MEIGNLPEPPIIIDTFMLINGVYDIVCSLCIMICIDRSFLSSSPHTRISPIVRQEWDDNEYGFLKDVCLKVSNIHLSMIADNEDRNNSLVQSLFSYWILTYGTVRLSCGMYCLVYSNGEFNANIRTLSCSTYIIEGFAFARELSRGSMVPWRARFVSVASLSIGLISFLYTL